MDPLASLLLFLIGCMAPAVKAAGFKLRHFPAALLASALVLPGGSAIGEEPPSRVNTLRVPHGGIQPQVALGDDGSVEMIYFRGDPGAGDIFYARIEKDGGFSDPIRVNSQEGSAIAAGNIRGPQLSVGKGGRVHVAWMGSGKAEPKGPNGETPMLYARLNDGGTAFEPQRNVIQRRAGLDGGGSLAADREGNVLVFWHAPDLGKRDEANRRVWVARSSDEGRTFSPEEPAFSEPTGACGCCGIRSFADSLGRFYVLYRSATELVNRDMFLLASKDARSRFQGVKIDPWRIGQCVMSMSSFFEGRGGDVLAAWETEGQVYYSSIAQKPLKVSRPAAAPGEAKRRRFPAVAANAEGEVILAWTEGMEWNRGGSVAWQVFDRKGRPLPDRGGRREGVPVWSLVAVFPRPDGGFTVVY